MLAQLVSMPGTNGVERVWRTPIEPAYGTFVGAFGGWTCAASLTAATELLSNADQQPLAMTINFLGPVPQGFAVVQPHVVVASKSTTHMAATVWSESPSGKRPTVPAATSSLVFAKRRRTEHVQSAVMPEVAAAHTVPRLQIGNSQVTWPEQYEQHVVQGKLLRPNAGMRSLTWSRNADLAALTFPRLAAMADASLPRIYFHFDAISPISTVTLSLQFHCDAAEIAAVGHDFVLIDASSQAASQGFFDQHLRIFAPNGRLLLSSTQLVWFNVLNDPVAAA
jgi:hypothetical protein